MPEFLQIKKIDMNLGETFIHKSAFTFLCDFTYTDSEDPWHIPYIKDSTTKYDNFENIPSGSVIWITAHYIEKFLNEIHPKIKNPYILLTYIDSNEINRTQYIDD